LVQIREVSMELFVIIVVVIIGSMFAIIGLTSSNNQGDNTNE
jgi:hypothetical protein